MLILLVYFILGSPFPVAQQQVFCRVCVPKARTCHMELVDDVVGCSSRPKQLWHSGRKGSTSSWHSGIVENIRVVRLAPGEPLFAINSIPYCRPIRTLHFF